MVEKLLGSTCIADKYGDWTSTQGGKYPQNIRQFYAEESNLASNINLLNKIEQQLHISQCELDSIIVMNETINVGTFRFNIHPLH